MTILNMSEENAINLPGEQQTRLHEVADLMLEIYNTLARMQGIQPQGIIRGPHDISAILPEYKKHNLDSAAIYLYTILPYVDCDLAGVLHHDQFFFGKSAFFNQLDAEDIARLARYRDSPDLPRTEGESMGLTLLPWQTHLSLGVTQRSSPLIYDAREHRIWVVNRRRGESRDPEICGEMKQEFRLGEDVENDEGYIVVQEPSDRERREAEGVENPDSLEYIPSRDAGDVLRDVHRYYQELKAIPGQGQDSFWMPQDVVKSLYTRHGWPENFDGDAFNLDWARTYCASHAQHHSTEPLRYLRGAESQVNYWDEKIAPAEKGILDAETVDQEWTARFELWKAKANKEENIQKVERQKKEAECLCPGGVCQKEEHLPLWEYVAIKEELRVLHESARLLPDRLERFKDNPKVTRINLLSHEHDKRRIAIYEKALAACQADRDRICPGREFEEATGFDYYGPHPLHHLRNYQQRRADFLPYVESLKEFAATVPDAAGEAKKVVDEEMKHSEFAIEDSETRIRFWEKRLKVWKPGEDIFGRK